MKFYELESEHLEFDGDKTDLRLHSVEQYNWGAKEEKDYIEAENKIESISYKGNGWEVYCWFDVSGWDYWMNQHEEPNYIMTTVIFEKEDIDKKEAKLINEAVENALDDALDISLTYNYRPNEI